MINFTNLRDDIISVFASYMGITVVLMDQNTSKPDYPYIGYKITSPYIQESEIPSEIYDVVEDNDPDSIFDFDMQLTRLEQPEMVISISSYSMDEDEAQTLALKACSWFKLYGYDHLNSINVVIVNTSNIQPRDVLIIDNYERRRGFDVRLRVSSELTEILPTIESVEYEKGE